MASQGLGATPSFSTTTWPPPSFYILLSRNFIFQLEKSGTGVVGVVFVLESLAEAQTPH